MGYTYYMGVREDQKLGRDLKNKRLNEGLSRAALSDRLGLSQKTIFNIEHGKDIFERTRRVAEQYVSDKYPSPLPDTPLAAPETRLVPGQAPAEIMEKVTALLREWHCDVRYFCEVFADSGIPDTAKFRKFAFWIDNAHSELHKSGLFPDNLCQKAAP